MGFSGHQVTFTDETSNLINFLYQQAIGKDLRRKALNLHQYAFLKTFTSNDSKVFQNEYQNEYQKCNPDDKKELVSIIANAISSWRPGIADPSVQFTDEQIKTLRWLLVEAQYRENDDAKNTITKLLPHSKNESDSFLLSPKVVQAVLTGHVEAFCQQQNNSQNTRSAKQYALLIAEKQYLLLPPEYENSFRKLIDSDGKKLADRLGGMMRYMQPDDLTYFFGRLSGRKVNSSKNSQLTVLLDYLMKDTTRHPLLEEVLKKANLSKQLLTVLANENEKELLGKLICNHGVNPLDHNELPEHPIFENPSLLWIMRLYYLAQCMLKNPEGNINDKLAQELKDNKTAVVNLLIKLGHKDSAVADYLRQATGPEARDPRNLLECFLRHERGFLERLSAFLMSLIQAVIGGKPLEPASLQELEQIFKPEQVASNNQSIKPGVDVHLPKDPTKISDFWTNTPGFDTRSVKEIRSTFSAGNS